MISWIAAGVMGGVIFTLSLSMIYRGIFRARIRSRNILGLDRPSGLIDLGQEARQGLSLVEVPGWFQRFNRGQDYHQAGMSFTWGEYQGLRWLLFLAAALFACSWMVLGGVTLIGGILRLGLLILAVLGPVYYVRWKIQKRARALSRAFPDFLDFLRLTVSAGLGFLPALKRVSEGSQGVIKQDLNQVISQIELGYSRSAALEHWSKTSRSSDVQRFVEAVNLSQTLGTSLARTLQIQSDLLRSRRRRQAEIKAQTTPIRIIPALVFCFLPSLLLIYLAPPIINLLLHR